MKNQEKLSRVIDHFERHLSNRNDARPTTGMVGQRCLGFVQDSNGNLIRIIPEIKGEECVGPGSYNPEKPTSFKKSVKISSNSKRTNFIQNDNFKVGPQSYNNAYPTSKKYKHEMRTHDIGKPIEPFKAGNLEHKPWIKKSLSPIPRNRFPTTVFKENKPSPFFASKQKREIFACEPDETELKYIPYDLPAPKDSPYFDFKNQVPRYYDDPNQNPSPCTYTLPDTFGKQSPAFDLSPSWVDINIKKVDKKSKNKKNDSENPNNGNNEGKQISDEEFFSTKLNTPGPGYYETSEKKKVLKSKSPVFANKIPRYRDFEYDDDKPNSCTYNIDRGDKNDKIPMVFKRNTNRPMTSWDRNSLDNPPGPGKYDPYDSKLNRAIKIKENKKASYVQSQDDHQYAFSTPHSSLIKRTYNTRYYHVNKYLVK